jgi:hypothetical protein
MSGDNFLAAVLHPNEELMVLLINSDFYSFYLNDKIYFFGGFQIFPGDNTGSFIYSFCTINYEWSLVNYLGSFPATNPLSPYLVYYFSFRVTEEESTV